MGICCTNVGYHHSMYPCLATNYSLANVHFLQINLFFMFMALRALYQSRKRKMTAEKVSNTEIVKLVLTNYSQTVIQHLYITTVYKQITYDKLAVWLIWSCILTIYIIYTCRLHTFLALVKLILYRAMLKATVILLPLLGTTWVFGLLTVNESLTVFAWIFTVLNSLQVSYTMHLCYANIII